MKTYIFEYSETLKRCIKVQAQSKNEAFDKMNDMIRNEKVVLSADDFDESYLDLINEF